MLLLLLACADPTPQPTPGVHIEEVLLAQASTVPMVQDGRLIDTRQTPIVADRDIEVRVTLSTDSDFIRHRVHVNVELLDAQDQVSIAVQEEWMLEPEGGWIQLTIPADLVQMDTAIAISVTEVSPDARPGETQDARKPQARFLELDAQEMPPLKVTLVPLFLDGMPPDLAPLSEYQDALMGWFPTPEVLIELHPTGMDRDRAQVINGYADEVAALGALRLEEGAIGAVYIGVYKGGDGGLAATRDIVPEMRAAVGPDLNAEGSFGIIGHEIGHLMGGMHTPACDTGRPDPNYPLPDGSVGVEIWDPLTATWLPPETTDLMGYCKDRAVSPYTAKIFAQGLLDGADI